MCPVLHHIFIGFIKNFHFKQRNFTRSQPRLPKPFFYFIHVETCKTINFCLPIYFIVFFALFSSRWAFIWPTKKKWFDEERKKVVIGKKQLSCKGKQKMNNKQNISQSQHENLNAAQYLHSQKNCSRMQFTENGLLFW